MTNETLTEEIKRNRKANYDISPLLLNRWSPRAMTGESLSDEELFPLFEAARWAPSSYNAQRWRFIIGRRQNAQEFDKFVGLLGPINRVWAKDAAALVVVVSRNKFELNDNLSPTHTFDAGAAWENLAVETARRGLVAHGMQGFDYGRAKTELNVPDDFEVHAMIAIGRRGSSDKLPDNLKSREQPNTRRPLREIVFEGGFGKTIAGLPD
jgi:nitroreductase